MNPGPKREIAEIQQEYQNLCLKAGHLQYQIFTHKKDLEILNQELRDLNLEASEVKAEEQRKADIEAKKAEGPSKPSVVLVQEGESQ